MISLKTHSLKSECQVLILRSHRFHNWVCGAIEGLSMKDKPDLLPEQAYNPTKLTLLERKSCASGRTTRSQANYHDIQGEYSPPAVRIVDQRASKI